MVRIRSRLHGASQAGARSVLVVGFVVLATAQAGEAQGGGRAPTAAQFVPGGELENYLRLLQLSGSAPWYPWSLRSFSGRELKKLLPRDTLSGPWELATAALDRKVAFGGIGFTTVVNSAFPYGTNDGAVWAGRGLTASASAELTGRAGPLSLTLAPLAFITTNGAFPLLANVQAGPPVYEDLIYRGSIDRPQRFGEGAYGRGDAGASEVRLDTKFLTAGFGTAPMSWGPASEYPFLLGANAGGFPHAFVGTGEPVNVGVGRFHGRAVWGKLSQSAFSPVGGSDRYVSVARPGRDRLMTGLVLIFVPRFAPTLEVGIARFAHLPYREGGIDGEFLRRAWPTFLKKNIDASFVEGENELASVFARWAFPAVGFELYAEHGHDDWYHDLRDLTQEPEHNKGYVLGFQKVLRRSPRRLSAVRGELINHEMPPLGRDRPGQGFIYTHSVLRQGHTQRGQLLGANAGPGSAAASVLAWDSYTPRGRTTLSWRRTVRAHIGSFYLNGIPDTKTIDVIHALGAERSLGKAALRYTFGADIMLNMNRNFDKDVFNLNARAGIQWTPGLTPTPN